jgi:hypothetical protein
MRSDPPPIEVSLLGIDTLLVNKASVNRGPVAVIKRGEKAALPAPWTLAIALCLERIAGSAKPAHPISSKNPAAQPNAKPIGKRFEEKMVRRKDGSSAQLAEELQ